jgi:hypothetical protein
MMNYCLICKAESTLEDCFKKHSRGRMNRIAWCRTCKEYFKRNKNESGLFCSDKCNREYVVPRCQERIAVFMYGCVVCKREFTINGVPDNWSCNHGRKHKLIFSNLMYVKTCDAELFYSRYDPNAFGKCTSVVCPGYTKERFRTLLLCLKRLGIYPGPVDVKRYLFTFCYESNKEYLRERSYY